MSLPHSATASVLLFAAAGGCIVIVLMRDEARAPLHGLHRVVRLPARAACSASLASFWSRITGSVHAVVGRRMQPTPMVLDEADDESEAWWGPKAAAPRPLPLALAAPEPEPDPEPEPERETVIPELVLEPIVAAPIQTARVPSHDAGVKVRATQLWLGVRTHAEALGKKAKRSREEELTPST